MRMTNIIKKIFIVFYIKPRIYFGNKKNIFFNYFLPNIKPFFLHKINLPKNFFVQQKLLCQGKGKVMIGNNCNLGFKLGGFWLRGAIELQARFTNSFIKIGNNVATNNNIFICAANYIEIGDNTLIGQYVTMMDFEAHGIQPQHRRELGEIGEIKIGKNCWIGNNVSILKNSEIGDNTIVANGAVVSGKFPENVIIGGIPAKIIREL